MASLKDSPLVQTVRANISNYTVVIAMVLIWALFGALTEGLFLSARNISNLFRQATLLSFLATGMVLVIVTGNIDLSVGSITGFTSVVAAALQVQLLPQVLPGMLPGAADTTIGIISTVITILVVLVIAFAIGVYQGSVIAYLRVPAFIVTLGGMQIFRGGVLGVTQGRTIAPIEESLRVIAQGYVSNIFGILVALLVIGAIFAFAMRNRAQKQEYGFEVPPMRSDLAKATVFSAVVLGFVLLMNAYRGVQVPEIGRAHV
jgi:D-xylose transport system permease protein